MERVDPAGMFGAASRHVDLPLQVPPTWAVRAGEADQGDLPDTRRKIRALKVVDTVTRLAPAIEVRQSRRSGDVVAALDCAAVEVGYPGTIRLDNGPEFISKELDLWTVTLDFSRSIKPTDNAFIETFNSKFRGECLNTNWFLSLDEATRKCGGSA
jgi:putative transposase